MGGRVWRREGEKKGLEATGEGWLLRGGHAEAKAEVMEIESERRGCGRVRVWRKREVATEVEEVGREGEGEGGGGGGGEKEMLKEEKKEEARKEES